MSVSTSPRGRRPSPAVRTAILDAAFAMLRDRGYAAMTIEAVAAAAGAGKATVYRWWVGKAELVVDAFFNATRAELAFPDTGTAEGDFRSQIAELAALLRGPRGAALAAMLGGSNRVGIGDRTADTVARPATAVGP